MNAKSILLYQNNCTAKHYLQALLRVYPFDIEEQMVLSLLKPEPYPYPALLMFIDYARHIRKYYIYYKQTDKLPLDALYTTMCKLSQRNQTVLYTHQFQLDASLHAKSYAFNNPYAHLPLNDIMFIDGIQLHIPACIDMDEYHPQSITKAEQFIYRNLSINADDFFALSIQIGDCHGLVFLPKKYISILCACATLYQICPPTLHHDFFLLYGISSQANISQIYEDTCNELIIGLHSGNENGNHFQYIKDMISTLYSCYCLKKHDFPLHGSMLQLHFPQKTIGVLLIGAPDTGKSALCTSLLQICDKKNIPYSKVFDDQGVLHNLDNDIYASGSEIGAFLHIDDLPQVTIYKQMSASVLLQEQQETTHVILPFTSIEEIRKFHKVDIIFYLDNTIKQINNSTLTNLQETFDMLLLGKHRAPSKRSITCPFWGSFAHAFDYNASCVLLHEMLTMMFVNGIGINHFSTYHPVNLQKHFYDKKALLLYQYIVSSQCEKEDCEKV